MGHFFPVDAQAAPLRAREEHLRLGPDPQGHGWHIGRRFQAEIEQALGRRAAKGKVGGAEGSTGALQ
jgi:hypothetical protein